MTPLIIDIDPLVSAIERAQGLLLLTENHLYDLNLPTKDFVPLNAALFCIREHLESIGALLNAGSFPGQEEVLPL
jgi:hypothetical protein